MQNLELQNVKISGGYSFTDQEKAIDVNGSFTVDNTTHKIELLNGTLVRDGVAIGTVAAHTNNEGRTFLSVSPNDMDDIIDVAMTSRDMFQAIQNSNYSTGAGEVGQESEEEVAEA